MKTTYLYKGKRYSREALVQALVDGELKSLHQEGRCLRFGFPDFVPTPATFKPVRVVEGAFYRFGMSGGHDYGCVLFKLPEPLARKIMDHVQTAIPSQHLACEGYEREPHITVKYGLSSDDPRRVACVLAGEGPAEVALGCTKTFEAADHDVVVLEVFSEDLARLHKKLYEGVGNVETFPVYKPHVTLAYVQKGLGQHFAGDDTFDGLRLRLDCLTFSPSEGEPVEMTLPLTAVAAVGAMPLMHFAVGDPPGGGGPKEIHPEFGELVHGDELFKTYHNPSADKKERYTTVYHGPDVPFFSEQKAWRGPHPMRSMLGANTQLLRHSEQQGDRDKHKDWQDYLGSHYFGAIGKGKYAKGEYGHGLPTSHLEEGADAKEWLKTATPPAVPAKEPAKATEPPAAAPPPKVEKPKKPAKVKRPVEAGGEPAPSAVEQAPEAEDKPAPETPPDAKTVKAEDKPAPETPSEPPPAPKEEEKPPEAKEQTSPKEEEKQPEPAATADPLAKARALQETAEYQAKKNVRSRAKALHQHLKELPVKQHAEIIRSWAEKDPSAVSMAVRTYDWTLPAKQEKADESKTDEPKVEAQPDTQPDAQAVAPVPDTQAPAQAQPDTASPPDAQLPPAPSPAKTELYVPPQPPVPAAPTQVRGPSASDPAPKDGKKTQVQSSAGQRPTKAQSPDASLPATKVEPPDIETPLTKAQDTVPGQTGLHVPPPKLKADDTKLDLDKGALSKEDADEFDRLHKGLFGEDKPVPSQQPPPQAAAKDDDDFTITVDDNEDYGDGLLDAGEDWQLPLDQGTIQDDAKRYVDLWSKQKHPQTPAHADDHRAMAKSYGREAERRLREVVDQYKKANKITDDADALSGLYKRGHGDADPALAVANAFNEKAIEHQKIADEWDKSGQAKAAAKPSAGPKKVQVVEGRDYGGWKMRKDGEDHVWSNEDGSVTQRADPSSPLYHAHPDYIRAVLDATWSNKKWADIKSKGKEFWERQKAEAKEDWENLKGQARAGWEQSKKAFEDWRKADPNAQKDGQQQDETVTPKPVRPKKTIDPRKNPQGWSKTVGDNKGRKWTTFNDTRHVVIVDADGRAYLFDKDGKHERSFASEQDAFDHVEEKYGPKVLDPEEVAKQEMANLQKQLGELKDAKFPGDEHPFGRTLGRVMGYFMDEKTGQWKFGPGQVAAIVAGILGASVLYRVMRRHPTGSTILGALAAIHFYNKARMNEADRKAWEEDRAGKMKAIEGKLGEYAKHAQDIAGAVSGGEQAEPEAAAEEHPAAVDLRQRIDRWHADEKFDEMSDADHETHAKTFDTGADKSHQEATDILSKLGVTDDAQASEMVATGKVPPKPANMADGAYEAMRKKYEELSAHIPVLRETADKHRQAAAKKKGQPAASGSGTAATPSQQTATPSGDVKAKAHAGIDTVMKRNGWDPDPAKMTKDQNEAVAKHMRDRVDWLREQRLRIFQNFGVTDPDAKALPPKPSTMTDGTYRSHEKMLASNWAYADAFAERLAKHEAAAGGAPSQQPAASPDPAAQTPAATSAATPDPAAQQTATPPDPAAQTTTSGGGTPPPAASPDPAAQTTSTPPPAASPPPAPKGKAAAKPKAQKPLDDTQKKIVEKHQDLQPIGHLLNIRDHEHPDVQRELQGLALVPGHLQEKLADVLHGIHVAPIKVLGEMPELRRQKGLLYRGQKPETIGTLRALWIKRNMNEDKSGPPKIEQHIYSAASHESDRSPDPAIVHEMGHALYRNLLTDQEKAEILKAHEAIMGNPRLRATASDPYIESQPNKNLQSEEVFADAFRFVLHHGMKRAYKKYGPMADLVAKHLKEKP